MSIPVSRISKKNCGRIFMKYLERIHVYFYLSLHTVFDTYTFDLTINFI